MKFFVKLDNMTFSISALMAESLQVLRFRHSIQNKSYVFVLSVSEFPPFRLIQTTSPNHFYISFFDDKKLRISKAFFNFLLLTLSASNDTLTTSLDKYYTKLEVVEITVSSFLKTVEVSENDLIVEPSAGDGSFIQPLRFLNCRKIFLDIAPENAQITRADFLEWLPPRISGKIHVIGNPPFGRQSSLCHKFIRHAATFADSISFILPISFKKQFNLSKIPVHFHLTKEIPLPRDAFFKRNFTFTLPTVFQI